MKRRRLLGLGGLMAGRAAQAGGPMGATEFAERVQAAKLQGSVFDLATEALPKVRIVLIGLGNRGSHRHARMACGSRARRDQRHQRHQPRQVQRALDRIAQFQTATPQTFTGSDDAWKAACSTELADLALICTPWEWHTPMAAHAMRQGLHAASEVPIATTYQEGIDLIQVAEETQRHCIMLENCCYNGEELWILNMIQEGVFGTLTHAECAYLHDLRVMMLDPTYYEDRWRLKHHLYRNGNLYTTHGLGPVCMYFDILRGDTLSTS